MLKHSSNHLAYRAVVSDLDNTLLNAEHKIGDYSAKVIHQLHEQGVDIILATGRHYDDVKMIFDKISDSNAMMITSNGACIHDLQGNLIYNHCLPADLAHELLNLEHDPKVMFVSCYQNNAWLMSQDIPAIKQYHQESGFTYQVTDFSQFDGKDTLKVFFIAQSEADLKPMEQYLREHYGERTEIVYSSALCLEIMHKGVSKGAALTQLLTNRDYSLEHCIAFGDNMNDETMLTCVGKGCIMQNAHEDLLRKLPHLERIGLSKDEAVAQYLQKVFQLD